MKTKKFLAFILALVCLTFSACGNGEDKADETGSAGVEETKNTDNSGKENETGDKDEKPDTWIADREITILVFESASDAGEGSMSPKIADYIKERTGFTMNIQSVSNENSTEALASGLAAGDLPDVIAYYLDNSGRPEFPILLKAANEGMFHDIAPYLKEGKIYSKYFEEGYLPRDTKENIMMREDQNGATYLVHMQIPQKVADPGRKTVGGLYIQKNIVDDLGIDPLSINTTEEFEKLLREIKAKDYKDKNGNSITPLGPTVWGGSDRPWVYNDMVFQGAGGQKFAKENGKIKHECMTDYGFNRVKLVQKWFKDGLMHPEFYTMEESRAQEGIMNLSFGVIADIHSYRPEVESGEWVPLGPLNRFDGKNNMVMPYKSGYTGWAVPATTKNPEEIVKFADWMAGPEGKLLYCYGLEGKHYTLGEDGKPIPNEDLVKLQAENPEEAMKEGFRGVRCWWGEHLCYTDMDNLGQFGEESWGDKLFATGEKTTGQKIAEMYKFDEKYAEKEVIDGLYPRAYLYEFEGDEGKLSQALDDWDESLLKAYYAADETEAEAILNQAKSDLEEAGIQDFCDFLKEKEDAGDTIFY